MRGFPAFAINDKILYEARSPSFSCLEQDLKRFNIVGCFKYFNAFNYYQVLENRITINLCPFVSIYFIQMLWSLESFMASWLGKNNSFVEYCKIHILQFQYIDFQPINRKL